MEDEPVVAPAVGGGPCGDVTSLHRALVRAGLGDQRVSVVEREIGVRLPSATEAGFDEQSRRVYAALEKRMRRRA